MVYCEDCRKSKGLRASPKKRKTYCEYCHKLRQCHDNPSWNVDVPKYKAKHRG